MAESGIFLIQNDGAFVRLKEQAYDSEEVLQRLLAQYPDVLAGGAGSGEPQRWLLVKREIAISDDEAGAARWYLDHLFIDQEGIPRLVEVKRSSDTRIRREVVGQMLDYAANAVLHWTVDRLESEFAATARSAGREPGDVLRELLVMNRKSNSGGASKRISRQEESGWFSSRMPFRQSCNVSSSS